jgi:hypothetical protein
MSLQKVVHEFPNDWWPEYVKNPGLAVCSVFVTDERNLSPRPS